MPVETPPDRLEKPISAGRRFLRSFQFAGAGIAFLFRTQRNARFHLAIGLAALLVAAWLPLRGCIQWAILILTIAMVLILEGINTAMETAIDLITDQPHPLAKIAKDLTAGMVLIAAIAAAGIGFLILGPPLWERLFR